MHVRWFINRKALIWPPPEGYLDEKSQDSTPRVSQGPKCVENFNIVENNKTAS